MMMLGVHRKGPVVALLLCCFFCPIVAHGSPYFTSAEALHESSKKRDTVILDARVDKAAYTADHIPGAIHVSWEQFSNTSGTPGKNWGVLLAPAELAAALGKLGIGIDSRVVVYIDPLTGWGEDGRIVWMLRLLGVRDASVLDGGIAAWRKQGFPVTRTVPKRVPRAFGTPTFDGSLVVDTKALRVGQKGRVLLDARSKKEFDGATDFGEKRGGHIPGALSLHYAQVFNPNGTLKDVGVLEKLFARLGLKKSDEIVVYCTAGIRSAHLTLVLRMLGFLKARNYDASFYEWAADLSLPVQ